MKLVSPMQLQAQLRRLYDQGMPAGDRTGWPSVDKLYSVAPGMLTIITGYPGSGKSEWLDALLLNLSTQGWLFAVYSPENLPHEQHISKWLEKTLRKPFRHGPTERMTWDEGQEALFEVGEHFRFITSKAEAPLNLADIIEASTLLFEDDFQERKHGLVIDPWNELEHIRPREISET